MLSVFLSTMVVNIHRAGESKQAVPDIIQLVRQTHYTVQSYCFAFVGQQGLYFKKMKLNYRDDQFIT